MNFAPLNESRPTYLRSREVTFRPNVDTHNPKRTILRVVVAAFLCLVMALFMLFLLDSTPQKASVDTDATLQPAIAGASQKASTATSTSPKKSASSTKPSHKKYVALTFDDGPSKYTPQVLAILNRYNAKGTFFTLGSEIKKRPGTARAIVKQGSQIASHTYGHKNMTYRSNSEIKRDIKRMRSLIKKTTGKQTNYLRPPYGATNKRVKKTIKSASMRQILWDKDTRDWSRPGVDAIVRRATKNVHNGDIILMHDGGGNRTQTLKALPKIIKKLKAQGYHFCTVADLYRMGLR